jgi:hypothetical protein
VSEASVTRSPRALWRRADAEVLVTLPEDEEVWRLSGGAAAVWLGLDEPSTAAELSEVLAEVYELPSATIAGDVDTALAELSSMGLVVSA